MTTKWNYQPLTNQQKKQSEDLLPHCNWSDDVHVVKIWATWTSPLQSPTTYRRREDCNTNH